MKYLRLFKDNYTKPEDTKFDNYVSYSETTDVVNWDPSKYIKLSHLTNISDAYVKLEEDTEAYIMLSFDLTATSGTLFSSQNINLSIIGPRKLKFTYHDQSQEFDIPEDCGDIIGLTVEKDNISMWWGKNFKDIPLTITNYNEEEIMNPVYLFSNNGTSDFFKGSIGVWDPMFSVKRRSDNKLGVLYNDVFYTSPNSDFTYNLNIKFEE